MKFGTGSHLTYCMNIHPGEAWTDQADALATYVSAVQRERVGEGGAFGVGLRLGDQAARALQAPDHLAALKSQLEAANQYVFTINGFPYGSFHGTRIKEQVYAPDWSQPERGTYTRRLADILVALEPPSGVGSISTVPGGYRYAIKDEPHLEAIVRQLMETVAYLADLEARTGCCIQLGLEPEPDCLLETTDEGVRFFEEHLLRRGRTWLSRQLGAGKTAAESWIRRHLGICLDTCHAALQFEDPLAAWQRYQRAGINVSKVQLSAALEGSNNAAMRQALLPFAEPVYLHQTRWRDPAGKVCGAPDLEEALDTLSTCPEGWALRVHFHVPLCWSGTAPLKSTRQTLTPAFWQHLVQQPKLHVEIETYTFDVLPPDLKAGPVTTSIIQEYEWVMDQIGEVTSPYQSTGQPAR